MTCQVEITNNATGETRLATMDGLSWEDHTLFWWTEGNFGCDCNRGDTWTHAGGQEPGEDDYPCGDKLFTVTRALLPDGTCVPIDAVAE